MCRDRLQLNLQKDQAWRVCCEVSSIPVECREESGQNKTCTLQAFHEFSSTGNALIWQLWDLHSGPTKTANRRQTELKLKIWDEVDQEITARELRLSSKLQPSADYDKFIRLMRRKEWTLPWRCGRPSGCRLRCRRKLWGWPSCWFLLVLFLRLCFSLMICRWRMNQATREESEKSQSWYRALQWDQLSLPLFQKIYFLKVVLTLHGDVRCMVIYSHASPLKRRRSMSITRLSNHQTLSTE